MNQMRPATKRDNLYTLSFFALKLWIFKLKLIPRVTLLKLANALPPGPCPGLTRRSSAPQMPGGEGLMGTAEIDWYITFSVRSALQYFDLDK